MLSLEVEDLESLVKEEPLEILDNPGLMMELSEDPVRLYLKEIGGIELLDTDREFWLSTRLEVGAAHRCVAAAVTPLPGRVVQEASAVRLAISTGPCIDELAICLEAPGAKTPSAWVMHAPTWG